VEAVEAPPEVVARSIPRVATAAVTVVVETTAEEAETTAEEAEARSRGETAPRRALAAEPELILRLKPRFTKEAGINPGLFCFRMRQDRSTPLDLRSVRLVLLMCGKRLNKPRFNKGL
jgi:hypothetical protein